MKSKLGAHIDVVQYPGQVDRIIQSGMKIVKVISTMEILQRIYAARGNSVTLIARDWTVGDNFLVFQGHINPKAKAYEWYTKMLPSIKKAPFAYWESFNEMDSWTYLSQYGEFEAERQRIMADNGYRCCIGNFAVGGPPIVDPYDIWPSFYPALQAAHQYKNLLGLHEYGALWIDTYYGPNSIQKLQAGQRTPLPSTYEEGWLFGLYRKVWNKHIKPKGWTDLKIAITEMGLMSSAPSEINAIAGYPVGSWRTCGPAWARLDGRTDTEQYYFEQLKWADKQYQADPYVVGGTIFTWGTFPESAWMKDEIQGPVADKLINYITYTADEPVPENKSMYVTGIDLSRHNGTFDFTKAFADGHRFVFLRYSVGTGLTADSGKDPSFADNFTKAKQAGLLVGAYHYMWSSGDLIDQIKLFTQLDPVSLDLPMVVDVEQPSITEANLRLFLTEIERITGRIPIIYTRKNVFEAIVGTQPKDWTKRYRLWIAQYPLVVGSYPTSLPIQWSNWEFWQFTDAGQVTGHTGSVDINYFNGSLENLKCRYDYPQLNELKLAWPVDSSIVTQPFGSNPAHYGPLLGMPGLGHEGIDFRALTGANVYACAEGIVRAVITTDAYGINVRIDHQNGIETIYAHLQQSLVTVGQRVSKGQQIALADNTGNSSGSHLHLTVKLEQATAKGLTAYPNDIINPTSFMTSPVQEQPVLLRPKAIVTLKLNIRSSPATVSTNIIGQLEPTGTIYGYPKAGEVWWRVRYNNTDAWMLSEWLEIVPDLYVAIRPKASMTTKLNIRSGPNTTFDDIGDILPNEVLLGIPTLDEWWRVKQDNLEGWALASWLEIIPAT